ncbi:MAG: release factor glutamine methyltransferase [Acidobacteriota bacterium]|jgi:release factor glutamine methyltransferase|nr:release factor glutamine methyltransferase [Acidobacteriota bacterium]
MRFVARRIINGLGRRVARTDFCLAFGCSYYSSGRGAQATTAGTFEVPARLLKAVVVKAMDERQQDVLTIADALREAATRLRVAGLDEPRREAGSLLSHTTARDSAFLITHADEALTAEQLTTFRASVERRAAGEPFQYIAGRQEFYGLEFEVNADVLIPRPETELLVEKTLELLKNVDAPLICDVGTGSGCIAVSILHARTDARGFALDISTEALRVAGRNAARHGVRERMQLVVSDGFDALGADEHREIRFDLIASNPPYIAEEDVEGLQREVREHEPRVALTPGGDGLSVIRMLLAEAPQFLKPGGHLLIEIGFDQHEQVAALIAPRVWTLLDVHRDLQGIPRTVALRLKE